MNKIKILEKIHNLFSTACDFMLLSSDLEEAVLREDENWRKDCCKRLKEKLKILITNLKEIIKWD